MAQIFLSKAGITEIDYSSKDINKKSVRYPSLLTLPSADTLTIQSDHACYFTYFGKQRMGHRIIRVRYGNSLGRLCRPFLPILFANAVQTEFQFRGLMRLMQLIMPESRFRKQTRSSMEAFKRFAENA